MGTHFRRLERLEQEARDIEIFEAAADELNLEMAAVLEFQAAEDESAALAAGRAVSRAAPEG